MLAPTKQHWSSARDESIAYWPCPDTSSNMLQRWFGLCQQTERAMSTAASAVGYRIGKADGAGRRLGCRAVEDNALH